MFVRYRERPDGLWGRTGMIRAFVFDLDGTLVETEELKALSYARAAAELRPDLNEAEVMEAFKDLVGLSTGGRRRTDAPLWAGGCGTHPHGGVRGGHAVAGLRSDKAAYLRDAGGRSQSRPGPQLPTQHRLAV